MNFIQRFIRKVLGQPVDRKYINSDKIKSGIAARKQRQSASKDDPGFWNPTDAQLAAGKKGGFSLAQFVKGIFDQGQLGSCTANGWAGAFATAAQKKFGQWIELSRLWIYYWERVAINEVSEDSGANVVDGANVLDSKGAPLEKDYPYSDDGTTFTKTPPAKLAAEASKYTIKGALQVRPDNDHILAALAAGMPVVFGFVVMSSFESATTAKTGVVSMPKPGEQELGGHCTYFIGATDVNGKAHFAKTSHSVQYSLGQAVRKGLRMLGIKSVSLTPPANCLIAVNSWGTGWGDKGMFYVPLAFVTKYCSDFYIFTDVTEA